MRDDDNDDCTLCGGCGEIETESRTTYERATVPCPECIAREIAEERGELNAEIERLKTALREIGFTVDQTVTIDHLHCKLALDRIAKLARTGEKP